ncbi:putative Filamentous hemagglutinin family protein [Gammaproteobacteria bacterium]
MKKILNSFAKQAMVAATSVAITAGAGLTGAEPSPHQLPTGGQVVAGHAAINQTGMVLNVTQGSPTAVINWNSFNIGNAAQVNFQQPGANATALNRVISNNPSQIFGGLSANGRIFLINPHGVLFGPNSHVNVGGIVASTLNISDQDFLNGFYSFSGGNQGGEITNQGTLTAQMQGYVGLVSPLITNNGNITAPLGTALLAAGDKVLLRFANDRLLSYEVSAASVDTAIKNTGGIYVGGGRALLTAKSANQVATGVVNHGGLVNATGVISTQTVDGQPGEVRLVANTVEINGTLDASAPNSGDGGLIETSGAKVHITDNAHITTKATQGKNGTWLIDPPNFVIAPTGGDITGAMLGNSLTNSNVIIQSDQGVATSGNGDIMVNDSVTWSTDNTLTLQAQRNINFNADITATGNNAGLVLGYNGAVADGNYFLLNGAKINLSGNAPTLKIGNLGSEVSYTVINSLGVEGDTTGVTLQGMNGNLSGNYALGSDIDGTPTSNWGAYPDPITGFMPIGNSISPFIGNFIGLGHIINHLYINKPYNIDSTGLFGSNEGNIANVGVSGSVIGGVNVGGLVGQNKGGRINNSYSMANVNGSSNVGGLTGYNSGIIKNSYNNTGNVTGSDAIGGLVGYNDYGTVNNSYSSGNVTGLSNFGGLIGENFLGIINNSYYNINQVMINNGSMLTIGGLYDRQYQNWLSHGLSLNISDYAATLPLTSDGYYMISDVQGIKNMLGFADMTGYKFRLSTDLDLSNDPGLFIPYFSSQEFDGGGHIISNLSVDQPKNSSIGFIGELRQGANLNNIGVENSNVNGKKRVGGLAGYSDSSITNSHYTGSVTGDYENIGGLAGYNWGTVTNSYNAGSVNGLISSVKIGGLVGYNEGILNNNYNTGNVSGYKQVGGLVGYSNSGNMDKNYNKGNVSGYSMVGGLVGYNYYSSISNNYSTGNVNGSDSIGGLVGKNTDILNNYHYNSHYNVDVVKINGQSMLTMGGLYDAQYQDWFNHGLSLNINDYIATLPLSTDGYYTISDIQGMKDMLGFVDVTGYKFRLATDLDFSRNPGLFIPYFAANEFNGGGHVITNLSIDQQNNSDIGFIGQLMDGSTLTNIGLMGNDIKGYINVGGLVGANLGTINNSYSTGGVSGTEAIGGLVGWSSNLGIVNNSYSTANVSGSFNVGGLVGRNFGIVINSYSAGKVIDAAPVTSGDRSFGGLVGGADSNATAVTNSYWDINTSGQTTSTGGTGLTTALMKQKTSFTGWDFTNTWDINDGQGYPFLRVASNSSGGSTTSGGGSSSGTSGGSTSSGSSSTGGSTSGTTSTSSTSSGGSNSSGGSSTGGSTSGGTSGGGTTTSGGATNSSSGSTSSSGGATSGIPNTSSSSGGTGNTSGDTSSTSSGGSTNDSSTTSSGGSSTSGGTSASSGGSSTGSSTSSGSTSGIPNTSSSSGGTGNTSGDTSSTSSGGSTNDSSTTSSGGSSTSGGTSASSGGSNTGSSTSSGSTSGDTSSSSTSSSGSSSDTNTSSVIIGTVITQSSNPPAIQSPTTTLALVGDVFNGRNNVVDMAARIGVTSFAPAKLASLTSAARSEMIAARHEFKTELFTGALAKLRMNSGLGELLSCDTNVNATKGTCLATPKQMRKLIQTNAKRHPRAAALPLIERKVALVIGSNAYRAPIPALESAVPDANAVARSLEQNLGYETRVLRDASKQDLVKALNQISGEIDPNDSVAIYYAGHGYLMDNGVGYWIPTDATIDDPGTWISNKDISRFMSQLPARQVMLISDSCYSGSLTREGDKDTLTRDTEEKKILRKRSVVVMSSGGEEPVSDEGKEGHSIFAWSLLRNLNGIQGWKPGYDIYRQVSSDVTKDFPQQPHYGALISAGHVKGGEYLLEVRKY